MKLIRHTPTKDEYQDDDFISSEEMTSDDINELKSKATELCRLMGINPSGWTSRYPIMGKHEVKSNEEFLMKLDNGTVFSIEIKI